MCLWQLGELLHSMDEGKEHENIPGNGNSLMQAVRSLGEGQERLSQTLESMTEHLKNHFAQEVAREILHAKGNGSAASLFTYPEPTLSARGRRVTTMSCATEGDAFSDSDMVSTFVVACPELDFSDNAESVTAGQVSKKGKTHRIKGKIAAGPAESDGTGSQASSPRKPALKSTRTMDPCEVEVRLAALKESDQFKQLDVLEKQRESKSTYGFGTRMSMGFGRKLSIGDRANVFQNIARSTRFQGLCAAMILLNSALQGLVADHLVDHDQEESWMIITNHFCSLFFLIELSIRMWGFGQIFFTGEDWRWNVFDFILVLQSLVDFALEAASVTQGIQGITALKTLKLLRVVRVIRVFRFFRELSIMVLMVANSMKSLTWAILLLLLMMYTFAISFVQVCNDNFKQHPHATHVGLGKEQFGSVARTIYSLILSILGGISWGEISDTLVAIGAGPTGLFLFYISFSLLAVLNIITGVFVENAVEVAKSRKDILLEKAEHLREEIMSELKTVFLEMDDDESGSINYDEMLGVLGNEGVKQCFTSMGLNPWEVEKLFKMIDEDNTGEIQIDDFLGGCLRLRGEARSIDVHAVLREAKKLERRFDENQQSLEDSFISAMKGETKKLHKKMLSHMSTMFMELHRASPCVPACKPTQRLSQSLPQMYSVDPCSDSNVASSNASVVLADQDTASPVSRQSGIASM